MNISELVNVQISLSGTAISAESYDHILIVGATPKTSEKAPAEVGIYTSLEEVETAGWISTEEIYKAASVAFANGASKLYIAVRQTSDTITTTLNRAKQCGGWYGFIVTDATEAEYTTITDWADANEKLYGFSVNVSKAISNPYGVAAVRTFGIATKSDSYAHVALMVVCMAVNAGGETWAYKKLTGITADDFTTTELTEIETAGLNAYVSCASTEITVTGKTVSGEWIDVIRFRDWLKNQIQTNVLNLLASNPKVPYTSAGIALVKSAIESALIKGQSQGGIAETEYTENETVYGYTITMPKMANVLDDDKQNRRLTGCKFLAKLAGAIHLVDIKGTLIA